MLIALREARVRPDGKVAGRISLDEVEGRFWAKVCREIEES